MAADRIAHFGYFIRWKRESAGLSRSRFLSAAGLSLTEKRLWEIEKMPEPKVYDRTLEGLAHGLGFADRQALDEAWRSTPAPAPDEREEREDAQAATRSSGRSVEEFLNAKGLAAGSLAREQPNRHGRPAERNVPIAEPRAIRAPLYAGVSAVRKDLRADEKTESIEIYSPSGEGIFAVRLDGACMEPVYEDGDIVILSISRWKNEGFVHGKDYFVRFADGTTTFKRILLDSARPEHVALKPVNESHKPWPELRRHVDFAARAIGRRMA